MNAPFFWFLKIKYRRQFGVRIVFPSTFAPHPTPLNADPSKNFQNIYMNCFLSDYRTVGLSKLSDYRTVAPSNCRTKELSDHHYAPFFSEHLGVLMTTTYNCKHVNKSVGENPLPNPQNIEVYWWSLHITVNMLTIVLVKIHYLIHRTLRCIDDHYI